MILAIETSGKTASVCLFDKEARSVKAEMTVHTEKTHSQIILPMCESLMKTADIDFEDIENIAVSKGPGSYTGLRIGIAAAKAMALGLGIKTYGISSLLALAMEALSQEGRRVCALIHARQDLWYAGCYFIKDGRLSTVFEEQILSGEELKEKYDKGCFEVIAGLDYPQWVRDETGPEIARVSVRAENLCRAAAYSKETEAEELNASYLQVTEAERNIGINGGKKS